MRPVDVSVLEVARERVAQGWCQAGYAEDEDGLCVHPHHTNAIRWCLAGALHSAAVQRGHTASSGILSRGYEPELAALCATLSEHLLRPVTELFLVSWNDRPDRTQEQVLTLFDRTIHTLSGESGR